MWELDHNTERWRTDAFELWCWIRPLRVPWTTSQSILKEINPEYSLEELMLKLMLQYFGHLMQKADSLEKTLTLGKIEGRRRKGWQRLKWLDGITNSIDMSWANSRRWWRTGKPIVLYYGVAELDMTEWLKNNTCWKLLPKSCFIQCFPTNILEGFCIPYADFSTLRSHSKDIKITYGELHKGTVWWFLKNLKTELLYNQTIPLLST